MRPEEKEMALLSLRHLLSRHLPAIQKYLEDNFSLSLGEEGEGEEEGGNREGNEKNEKVVQSFKAMCDVLKKEEKCK